MSAWILATGVADTASADALLREPQFRKATRNMALATAAALDLFAKLPAEWQAAHGAGLSSVLGTSDGELDVTVQFLKVFGGQGLARPFLFQSSLHNATLGFLSERFGWQGPGATLSGYDTCGEEALEMASDWALAMPSPFAIALGVDGLVQGAGGALDAAYPARVTLREGAGAILLARPGATGLPRLATFEGWQTESGSPQAIAEPYYDSSAIEIVARALTRRPAPCEVRRQRPDGAVTRIRLGAA